MYIYIYIYTHDFPMRQGAAVLLVQKLSRSTTGSTRVERDYSQSQMGLDKARNSTGGSRLAEN